MGDIRELLLAHAARYPAMQPSDAIKLLYQSEFGGGHLVSDEEKSLQRLKEEWASLSADAQQGVEDIGGGQTRVHLGGIPSASLQKINALFIKGASYTTGSRESFEDKLRLLYAMNEAGQLPFTPDALRQALREYRDAGYPMVSHSAVYRDTYRPAYRVMPKRLAVLVPLILAIDARLAATGHAVVAIDGQCGSGKSTIAGVLKSLYGCPVVAMDDFFLPLSLRTPQRLSEPGGNVHYERFQAEVLPHLGKETFSYRVFDHRKMDYGDTASIPDASLTLVEGSYSLHPIFGRYYNLSAYVRCSAAERLSRIYTRCGGDEEWFGDFTQKWIPMEDRYCAAFGIDKSCDLIIET